MKKKPPKRPAHVEQQLREMDDLMERTARLFFDAEKVLGHGHRAAMLIGNAAVEIRDSWPVPSLKLVKGAS